MTKLTPAQLAILRRMEKGEEISLCAKGIRVDTLWILQRRGIIEPIRQDWCGSVFGITPAGRAYLEELDENI